MLYLRNIQRVACYANKSGSGDVEGHSGQEMVRGQGPASQDGGRWGPVASPRPPSAQQHCGHSSPQEETLKRFQRIRRFKVREPGWQKNEVLVTFCRNQRVMYGYMLICMLIRQYE